jgi:hypothetical protein
MRPRPLTATQVHFAELQCVHSSDGGNQKRPQASQCGISSFRSRNPSQYGLDSDEGIGSGLL